MDYITRRDETFLRFNKVDGIVLEKMCSMHSGVAKNVNNKYGCTTMVSME